MARRSAISLRRWLVALIGVAWAQAGLALSGVAQRRYSVIGRVAQGWQWRAIEATALAPLSVVRAAIASWSPGAEPTAFTVGLSCSVAAMALALCGAALIARWKRPAMALVVVAMVLATAASVSLEVRRQAAVSAEREFFALVSRAERPSADDAAVSAARTFVTRHPESRWVGEALRIVAEHEWNAGHYQDAAALWSRFEAQFADPLAPGVAYAEYSRGLCDEQLGEWGAAAARYRTAVAVITSRGDGVQSWIAETAASRLAFVEARRGLVATSEYWRSEVRAFSDARSIE